MHPPCVRNPLWQGLSAALAIMSLYQIHYSKFRQNPADGRVAPLRLSRRGGNALSRQRLCDLERGVPRKEITEDATDYFCLFPIDDQPSVLALVVAEEIRKRKREERDAHDQYQCLRQLLWNLFML